MKKMSMSREAFMSLNVKASAFLDFFLIDAGADGYLVGTLDYHRPGHLLIQPSYGAYDSVMAGLSKLIPAIETPVMLLGTPVEIAPDLYFEGELPPVAASCDWLSPMQKLVTLSEFEDQGFGFHADDEDHEEDAIDYGQDDDADVIEALVLTAAAFIMPASSTLH